MEILMVNSGVTAPNPVSLVRPYMPSRDRHIPAPPVSVLQFGPESACLLTYLSNLQLMHYVHKAGLRLRGGEYLTNARWFFNSV